MCQDRDQKEGLFFGKMKSALLYLSFTTLRQFDRLPAVRPALGNLRDGGATARAMEARPQSAKHQQMGKLPAKHSNLCRRHL